MDCHILDRSPCHYIYAAVIPDRSIFHVHIEELKQWRRRWQRERQQISKTTTWHVHHAFFVHFLAVVAWLTTWECLISRFVEDGNSRHQLCFSFLELWYSLLGFKSNRLGLRIYILRACLSGGGGPQIGEVTYVAGHPTYHVNVIMRLYGQVDYLTYLGFPTAM